MKNALFALKTFILYVHTNSYGIPNLSKIIKNLVILIEIIEVNVTSSGAETAYPSRAPEFTTGFY